MLKKTENGYELARFGDLGIFLEIICEQYKVYSNFQNKRPNLDQLEPEDIIRLNHNQIDPLYISTLFSAMFLEAYIYDYGARKSSASYIENYIDKLSPQAKCIIVTQLFNEVGIDASSQTFEGIKKIFGCRNSLAHNKTKEYNGLDSLKDKKPKTLKPLECVDIIINVMNELLSVDPDELYASIVIERLNTLKNQYPVSD
ncbi:hypothetical protein [Chamaesiphon sp. OTE_75_metabat_556]|uniref:hypothetical protein n=1 Tax=Chamaesiphon sp. OTE_75_metabat_556 TaxID=2964692 RepID=UPI00286C595B|nr:hypothetical protein [Chamaesiphon sp. OTE_75_metabat_556]